MDMDMNQKMYQLLGVARNSRHPSKEELERARHVYGNYVERRGEDAVSFVEFLLTDVGYERYDSFTWDKGILVKAPDGRIGMTCGWSLVGFSASHFEVTLRMAGGEVCYTADQLVKADIPPEVLEYVKSTLKPVVQAKVDEAFAGEGGE